RYILSTMRSENQYDAKFSATANTKATTRPLSPARAKPARPKSVMSAAMRAAVRSPLANMGVGAVAGFNAEGRHSAPASRNLQARRRSPEGARHHEHVVERVRPRGHGEPTQQEDAVEGEPEEEPERERRERERVAEDADVVDEAEQERSHERRREVSLPPL